MMDNLEVVGILCEIIYQIWHIPVDSIVFL